MTVIKIFVPLCLVQILDTRQKDSILLLLYGSFSRVKRPPTRRLRVEVSVLQRGQGRRLWWPEVRLSTGRRFVLVVPPTAGVVRRRGDNASPEVKVNIAAQWTRGQSAYVKPMSFHIFYFTCCVQRCWHQMYWTPSYRLPTHN